MAIRIAAGSEAESRQPCAARENLATGEIRLPRWQRRHREFRLPMIDLSAASTSSASCRPQRSWYALSRQRVESERTKKSTRRDIPSRRHQNRHKHLRGRDLISDAADGKSMSSRHRELGCSTWHPTLARGARRSLWLSADVKYLSTGSHRGASRLASGR